MTTPRRSDTGGPSAGSARADRTCLWDECLDDFAASLHRQRAALRDGRLDDLAAFCPPDGLGPLPPRLADRALALLGEARAVEAALDAATTAHLRQMQLVSALHPAVAAAAVFLDVRA